MLDRRSFMLVGAATMFPSRLWANAVPDRLQLWPGEPPGGGGPEGSLRESETGAVSNVAVPFLEVFVPQRPNGASILVAAGGGYKRIEKGKEAYPAAGWLAELGVTAFVLTYRLPGEGWRNGPLAPLQDAQRALRMVRAAAAQFGLDPHRTGVMGFSAGGHLLGLASTRSDFHSYPAADATDALSGRPDFTALIYPVVTLEPPYGHTSTRRELIGDHPTPEARAEWSVETHVRGDCPPMFLAQADDDQVSDPANTRILEAACQRAGVKVELHRFSSGGHGFAMGRPGTPTQAWPGMCRNWLSALAVLG
jgi:acetyl esterase/lipase